MESERDNGLPLDMETSNVLWKVKVKEIIGYHCTWRQVKVEIQAPGRRGDRLPLENQHLPTASGHKCLLLTVLLYFFVFRFRWRR